MEILQGVKIADTQLGIFIEEYEALIIADLHIGYEAALQKQGVFLPASQYPKIKEAVARMLEICEPKLLIIDGDVKHEFGEATSQEWRETLDFLDFIQSQELKLTVVRGNHDNFLIPILKKRRIELCQHLVLKPYLFVHGHENLDLSLLKKEVTTLLIGHEHPAIAIKDELGVTRKFKCFLKSRLWGKNLVVMPALSPLMEGSAINVTSKSELLSPLLKVSELKKSTAYVVEEKVYKFPLEVL